ncbi:MAG: transposase, partial [Oscillospiraceae bacterium]|nr:transposase [Oscillospiraceae bacterium]
KAGEFYIYLSVIQDWPDVPSRTGNAVGLDFGIKHFLTMDNGKTIDSPQWYLNSIKEIRNAHRAVSRCQKGSNNRRRALQNLERIYKRICNRRQDWFFKLANELVSQYAVICIENLNLEGMKHLWGRKVSDIAYGEFTQILEWVARKNGCTVVKVDRWMPSSKACHVCGTLNTSLRLSDRTWQCESCGTTLDRDANAAINIREAGLSLLTA